MALVLKLQQHIIYFGSQAAISQINKARNSIVLKIGDEFCEVSLEDFNEYCTSRDIEPLESGQGAASLKGVS